MSFRQVSWIVEANGSRVFKHDVVRKKERVRRTRLMVDMQAKLQV